jgi:hypothetical protein
MPNCYKEAGAGVRILMTGRRWLMGLSIRHQRKLPNRETACWWLLFIKHGIPEHWHMKVYKYMPSLKLYVTLPLSCRAFPKHTFSLLPWSLKTESEALPWTPVTLRVPCILGLEQLGFVCFSNKIGLFGKMIYIFLL